MFPDSEYYLKLANDIRRGTWAEFYFRTPGYPLFLWFTKLFAEEKGLVSAVLTVQFVLGAATLPLMYMVFNRLVKIPVVAALGILVAALDFQTLMFRQHILTETSSLFLVSTLFFLLIVPRRKTYLRAVITGFILFALVMVRPSFQLLGWAILFASAIVYLRFRPNWKELTWYAVVAVSAQVLLFGWAGYIKSVTGRFTVSHGSGVVLMSHTSFFIDQYERGPLLPYQQAFQRALDNGVAPAHAIFPAMKEVQEELGLEPYQIADKYLALAKWLIIRNVGDYLKQVGHGGLVLLADSPSGYYADSDLFKALERNPILNAVNQGMNQHFWGRATRLWAVWLLPGIILLALFVVRRSKGPLVGLAIIVSTAYYNVLLHSAVNTDDLARYRIPLQPWVLGLIPLEIYWIISGVKSWMHPAHAKVTN